MLSRPSGLLQSRLALACLAVGLVAALASTALAYQFFLVDDLAPHLAKHVGKKVKFVDKLVKIWTEQELEAKGYIRFDTHHFRCAIPTSETEGIALLRELLKKQEPGDKTPDGTPPLVCILGTVDRPNLWKSDERPGADPAAGKDEDTIVIVVDKVEKPRQRFFDEGY